MEDLDASGVAGRGPGGSRPVDVARYPVTSISDWHVVLPEAQRAFGPEQMGELREHL